MSAGLTPVFGVMQVINLAHGSFYMTGAYVAATVTMKSGSFMLGLLAALLLLDEATEALLRISNRACVMEKGMIVWNDEHPFAAFADEIKMRYLGV